MSGPQPARKRKFALDVDPLQRAQRSRLRRQRALHALEVRDGGLLPATTAPASARSTIVHQRFLPQIVPPTAPLPPP